MRIGDISTVKGGKRVPKGYSLLDNPTSHIYIRVTNMKENTLIPDKLKYISDEIFQTIKNYVINKDDLYLTIAGTIGEAGIVPTMFNNMNLTENAVKLTNIQINKSFLLKLLQSPAVQYQFHQKTNKVAQPKLAIERILSTYIPLPPLKEQERIVSRIATLDPFGDDYDQAETELSTLNNSFPEQIKKSILQYAIQGKLVPQDPKDEPASVLLENIKTEKQKLIKAGKIKKDKVESYIYKRDNRHYEKIGNKEVDITDEIPFEIPDSWAWVRLERVSFVTKLAGFEYTKYIANNLTSAGIPLFKGKNIQDGKIIYSFESYIPKETSDFLIRSQINGKCILTPYVGTIGNIAIHNRKGRFHLGSNVGKIELFNNFSQKLLEEYVLFYLKSDFGYKELTKHKKATAQESISIEAIRDVLLPIPPLNEQNRIVARVEELLKLLPND